MNLTLKKVIANEDGSPVRVTFVSLGRRDRTILDPGRQIGDLNDLSV